VQPVRGQVIVPEPLELAESYEVLAPAWAAAPLVAWQVEDVQPVAGHMYVWPAAALAEDVVVPAVACEAPTAWMPP
jgi:hypothetical protein